MDDRLKICVVDAGRLLSRHYCSIEPPATINLFDLARPLVLPFYFKCDIIISDMAKKNNTKRKLVGLVSEESGVRAYYTKKNTMNTPDKLSLRKYDPVLRKHVLFVETKKNLGRNEVKEKKR